MFLIQLVKKKCWLCPAPGRGRTPSQGPWDLVGRGAARDNTTYPSLSPFFGLIFLLISGAGLGAWVGDRTVIVQKIFGSAQPRANVLPGPVGTVVRGGMGPPSPPYPCFSAVCEGVLLGYYPRGPLCKCWLLEKIPFGVGLYLPWGPIFWCSHDKKPRPREIFSTSPNGKFEIFKFP